jgi:hypothetical protein
MRVVSIGEVKQLDPKETVPCVRGTIKSVFKPNKGTNDKGPWAIQNVIIKDGSGEIKVSIRNHELEVPMSAKNQPITIACHEGDRGKTGVYAEDDEYRGQVERILKVTGSASIEIGNGSAPAEQTKATQADDEKEMAARGLAPAQPTTSPAPGRHTATANGNGNGNGHADKVRDAAKVRARDYYRVLEAVQEMRQAWDAKHPGSPMTDGHFQAACASVFIKLDRDGVFN